MRPWLRFCLWSAAAVLTVVLLVVAGTGQSVGRSMAVIRVADMDHCAGGVHPELAKDCQPESFGALGTLDPGDIVFVKRVVQPAGVTTTADRQRQHYGDDGDVLAFWPIANHDIAILHRALFWLQVNGDGTYTVPSLDLVRVTALDDARIVALTACALPTTRPFQGESLTAADSGFITRGDNNPSADQCMPSGMGIAPVTMDEIWGVARGEVPWFGLVPLAWRDLHSGTNFVAGAPTQSKALVVATVALVAAATTLLAVRSRRRRGEPGPGAQG